MDAVTRLRVADAAELALYCDRVACAVGRLCCGVFGTTPAAGVRLAGALGEALQLTNILRDIHEDALRDHVYLPADLMRRHGIADVETTAFLDHAGLAAVCAEIAALAERRFDEADAAMRACDKRAIRPALIMKVVYHDVLRALKARGWTQLAQPIHQSKLRKCGLIARSFLPV
jgi:phytoene synthase